MLKGKKGSYIVEATLVLPVFLIAMIVMCSIISAYSCIEDANYISANHIRKSAAVASIIKGDLATPVLIQNEIDANHSQIRGFSINSFRYREKYLGNDEIISLDANVHIHTENPLGLNAKSIYRLKTISRAYVGKSRQDTHMSIDDLTGGSDKAVYIFPKNGEKYHNKGCTFMKSRVLSTSLTETLRSKYKPCPICKSRKVKPGNLVYYYPVEGECYHQKGCSVMEKHYIEVTKTVAERRGYSPCSKCGG